jgi:ubiquitin-conjugating enzyme E2 O
MGTTDGTAASELYNERTLVLTRAFVKRACEYPPTNFSREIAAYYYNGLPGSEQAGGALQGIIEQSRLLLEESERWHAEQDKREEAGDQAEDVRQPPKSGVVPSQRILTEGAGLSLCVALSSRQSRMMLTLPITLRRRRTLKALEDLQKRGPKLDEPQAA